MRNGQRRFLGHDLGRERFVLSTLFSVDDIGPGDAGCYTICTALPPAAVAFGGSFGVRRAGIDYDHLRRRKQTAVEEEADYGLSLSLLAMGAEYAYDARRLADALKS